mmetsp:Transcript_43177/g.139405  ORF Transcript_43177/g.139405 Transcript_43177/m.139405 type:complete len:297 (-) Transcript_43177:282-1172(-)
MCKHILRTSNYDLRIHYLVLFSSNAAPTDHVAGRGEPRFLCARSIASRALKRRRSSCVKPWCCRKSRKWGSSAGGAGSAPRSSSGSTPPTEASSWTSWRARRACSACAMSASLRFDFFIDGAAARTASSVPCSPSSFAAVFWPTPGTPGTLSLASPTSASRSTSWSGRTPCLACTAAASSSTFLRSSNTVTLVASRAPASPPLSPLTSWSRSLSEVTIDTAAAPSERARATAHAIRSSASTPKREMVGTPRHSAASRMWPIWERSAGGMGARVSLYSGSISTRRAGAPSSKTASMR